MSKPAFHAPFNPRDLVPSGRSPQILRRWSVAELVAAATWPRVFALALRAPPDAPPEAHS